MSGVIRGNPLPWYLSGWGIVSALVVFWPAGLVLLALRLNRDRSFQGVAGRVLQVVGGLIILVGGLGLLGGWLQGMEDEDFGHNAPALIFMVLFAAGGIVMLKKGSSLHKFAQRRRTLVEYIVNQGITSLDIVANRSGIPVETVMADVKRMVESGFLPGFEFNPATREICRWIAPVTPDAPPPPPMPHREFVCRGCGARNSVVFRPGALACEYCELPVSSY